MVAVTGIGLITPTELHGVGPTHVIEVEVKSAL